MFNEDFRFTKEVGAHISRCLNGVTENSSSQMFEIVYSDDIMPKKVIRIRPFSFENYSANESIELLRELAEECLNLTLRGFREITKIFTTKSQKADCNYVIYNKVTGKMEESKENFIIETDGVALQQVLAIEGVDATKTTSNSVTEIL
jgi:DNA-directed RNA polymerase II subunit RPB1